MNSLYSANKKKMIKKDWRINDLCAVLIRPYGNWYRGNVLKVDLTKQTASVS